jgi:hypothetical protein
VFVTSKNKWKKIYIVPQTTLGQKMLTNFQKSREKMNENKAYHITTAQ